MAYKQQIAYGISYLSLIGSVAVLAGVRQMAWLLIIIHLALSAIQNNPLVTSSATEWDVKFRELCYDLIVLTSLVMVTGIKVYK